MGNSQVRSLKRSSDFVYFKRTARKLKPSRWLTIYVSQSPEDYIQFGIIASRKVGSAVVRNKLKRWVRSLIRDPKVKHTHNVFIFAFHSLDPDFFKNLKYRDFKEALENEKFF